MVDKKEIAKELRYRIDELQAELTDLTEEIAMEEARKPCELVAYVHRKCIAGENPIYYNIHRDCWAANVGEAAFFSSFAEINKFYIPDGCEIWKVTITEIGSVNG